MIHVDIVVLNWNQPDITVECLDSLEKMSRKKDISVRVVIVDNGSNDTSIDRLKRFIHDKKSKLQYVLIQNNDNLGFAGGNNVGISRSIKDGSDFVFILNNDTEVDKNLVVSLLKAAEKYPKTGIFAPKIYFANGYEFHKNRYKKRDLGNVIWAVGGTIDWENMYGSNRGVDEVDIGQFENSELLDFASGAGMFCRTKALKEVGKFDENYYLYFEDTDLSMRMKQNNWEVRYIPDAKFWHKVSQSSAVGGKLNDYFITRNRLLFASKYASLRTKFALFRESVRFLLSGREWQRKGVIDFYLHKFGKGSWES